MILSSGDRDLIEENIYHELLVKCCEKDKLFFEEQPRKTFFSYDMFLNKVIEKANVHLSEVRKELNKRKIKVEKVSQDDMFVTFSFKINGFQENHTYYKKHIRNQVKKRFDNLCGLN